MTNTLPTLAAITISSQKWEESVTAWKKYFGYEILESGYLSKELVRTWNAPKNVDSRIAILAPENGNKRLLALFTVCRLCSYCSTIWRGSPVPH